MVLLIVWMLSHMTLLSWADLSYVLPVTSVGYVLAAVAGRLFLAEQITMARWAGIALIVAGCQPGWADRGAHTAAGARRGGRPVTWALVAIIVAATTVGEVLQVIGMRHHGEVHDFPPRRAGPTAGRHGAQTVT